MIICSCGILSDRGGEESALLPTLIQVSTGVPLPDLSAISWRWKRILCECVTVCSAESDRSCSPDPALAHTVRGAARNCGGLVSILVLSLLRY